MRLRLVHTLSLWLLAAVAASVLAMGSVTAWNLGQGFSTYLQARDVERLDSFAQRISAKLEVAGGLQALRQRQIDWSGLLHEVALDEGDASMPAPAPAMRGDWSGVPSGGPPGGTPPMHGQPPPPPGTDMRAHPPPPGGPGSGFGDRVAIFDLEGQQLMGRPVRPGSGVPVERKIELQGKTVGVVRLQQIERESDANEVRFLRTQYLGMAGVAVVLLLTALAVAAWLSRQWALPLAAVHAATARIAGGELGVRVPTTRSDEIGDVVKNVNLMAESLQRMEGARRRWMADISHELRTPLAVLRGEAEALLDGVRPINRAAIVSLHSDMLRLGALVDDLHLLAMADLRSLPCRLSDCDAIELVHDTVRRFEARALSAGLTLTCAAMPSQLAVLWDPGRIEQLLGNLLENSLRYTDAPGRVEVALTTVGDTVRLSVGDSAPGAKPEELSRLFEPLYRADAARGRHTGGSGLGLAICDALAQAHGGSMAAQASPLGGLLITAVLPIQARSQTT
jgi:two-component system sensor histidine kinase BaeS